jgi:hypothetical protein
MLRSREPRNQKKIETRGAIAFNYGRMFCAPAEPVTLLRAVRGGADAAGGAAAASPWSAATSSSNGRPCVPLRPVGY